MNIPRRHAALDPQWQVMLWAVTVFVIYRVLYGA